MTRDEAAMDAPQAAPESAPMPFSAAVPMAITVTVTRPPVAVVDASQLQFNGNEAAAADSTPAKHLEAFKVYEAITASSIRGRGGAATSYGWCGGRDGHR